MNRNIKLTIEYDGTNYSGWQSQKNTSSIQQIIEESLSKILNSKIKITAAGRTDAGVHAFGQAANFKTENQIPLWNLKNGTNSILPHDISIKNCEEVSSSFHARYDAKLKHYRYTINRSYSPLSRLYTYSYTYELSMDILKESIELLIGRNDFTSFTPTKNINNNFVRTIERIDIVEENDFIQFHFYGQSFLYNMIRIIVGTLLDMSRNNENPEKITKILQAKDRRAAGPTAPACGLVLMEVSY